MTDTQLLDFLDSLEVPHGYGWLLYKSTTGRGWRLATTSAEGKHATARAAISAEMIVYGCGYEVSEGEFAMFYGPCLTLDKAMECTLVPAGNDYPDRAVILKFKDNPPVSEITHRWNRLDRSWHPV